MVPLELCVEKSSPIPVTVKYSMRNAKMGETDHTKFMFFKDNEDCHYTYPSRSLETDSIRLELFNMQDQSARITLKANYMQVLRESILNHTFTFLYMAYVMIFLAALTKNSLVAQVVPPIVLFMHTTMTNSLLKLVSGTKMNLTLIDFFVVYSCSYLLSNSRVFNSLFFIVRRFISINIAIFVEEQTVEEIYSWIIPIGQILALGTGNHLLLANTLIF